MFAYLSLGLAATTTIAAGTAVYLNAELKAKQNELIVEQVELAACGARLQNLIEDVRSDNEIDNLPNDALTVVPPHWLRPMEP